MEKRLYQRIPINISAIVTTGDDAPINVVAVDISSNGLGIECNIQQWNTVTPRGSFIRDGRPLSVVVKLNLPDENGQLSKFEAKCHVIFSRRMSMDQCKIGLRFASIQKNCYQRLVRYIQLAEKNADL